MKIIKWLNSYMAKWLKYSLVVLLLGSFVTMQLGNHFVVSPVFAQGATDLGPEPAQFKHLETYFSRFLNTATTWAIIAVFAMLVLGGIKLLTAGGDPKAVESAQATITYAILGLALLIGAWFILKFIEIFTGVNVTIFNITFD